MGITYFVINVVLIAIALKVLGSNFGVKTVFNMVALTLLFAIPQDLFPGALIKDNFLAAVSRWHDGWSRNRHRIFARWQYQVVPTLLR